MKIVATQILLHHILIQSGHYDDNKDATEKLLVKVLSAVPVIKFKYSGVWIMTYHLPRLSDGMQV
jgi:hypothetical protein